MAMGYWIPHGRRLLGTNYAFHETCSRTTRQDSTTSKTFPDGSECVVAEEEDLGRDIRRL